MSLRLSAAVLLLAYFTDVSPVHAQAAAPQAPSGPSPAEVKQSIQRAIEFLRNRQTEKGHWVFEREAANPDNPQAPPRMQEDPAFNLGLTALAAMAMVENGVLPSDPAIQKAYAYVKEESLANKRTYNLGLSILLLSRLGSREDRPLIQRLARRLMLGQFDSGGWPYDCPIDSEREASRAGLQGYTRKGGVGDNSNTQFAVLGLWAASRAGVQVDESLELVAKRFRDSQASSGGWDYQSTGKGDSNAMTTAGVYALTVAAASASRKGGTQASVGGSTSKATSKPTTKIADSSADSGGAASVMSAKAALAEDAVFKKAIARVEQFANEINPTSSPYFLWSIERLGVTLQMPTFGQVDWYAKGVSALRESQKSNGSWELAWKGPADTAFALLFLRKAHLGRDISYALTGDASKPFVLLGKEKSQAFAKLAEAIAAAADGNTIEINGHGPFEVAGITTEGKSLTFRCGDGFEPVFSHKLELLQDASRESSLRSIFAVKAGTLTLEGIRVQMDPEQKGKVEWTSVAVDGGELRAVNCSFSQSNSAAVTGVELRGAAKLNLQNCAFVGFARALDSVTTGDQSLRIENCLVYSRIGIVAKSPIPKDAAGLSADLRRNTFHVGEVINLGSLTGPADFSTEANIFSTSIFSSGIRPSASTPVLRKWEGQRNVFDLTRWLSTAGQAVREVRDLETWRKYWKTPEEGSFTRSVPFAVKHQLGPFRHNANPNDWRVNVERLSAELDADVQLGCDVYLVGAGQAFSQFKESIAYDRWRGVEPEVVAATASSASPADDAKLIEGTWLPVEAELNGQKLNEDVLKTMKLIIKDGKYSVFAGTVNDQGTLRLDPAKSPKTMDILGTEGPNQGKTILTIYELAGDNLRVCYALGGDERPAAFATKPDTNLFLVTYKRAKP